GGGPGGAAAPGPPAAAPPAAAGVAAPEGPGAARAAGAAATAADARAEHGAEAAQLLDGAGDVTARQRPVGGLLERVGEAARSRVRGAPAEQEPGHEADDERGDTGPDRRDHWVARLLPRDRDVRGGGGHSVLLGRGRIRPRSAGRR